MNNGLVRAIEKGHAVRWLILHGQPRRAWHVWQLERALDRLARRDLTKLREENERLRRTIQVLRGVLDRAVRKETG